MNSGIVFKELVVCRAITHRSFKALVEKSGVIFDSYTSISRIRLQYESLLDTDHDGLEKFKAVVDVMRVQIEELRSQCTANDHRDLINCYGDELEVALELVQFLLHELDIEEEEPTIEEVQCVSPLREDADEIKRKLSLSLSHDDILRTPEGIRKSFASALDTEDKKELGDDGDKDKKFKKSEQVEKKDVTSELSTTSLPLSDQIRPRNRTKSVMDRPTSVFMAIPDVNSTNSLYEQESAIRDSALKSIQKLRLEDDHGSSRDSLTSNDSIDSEISLGTATDIINKGYSIMTDLEDQTIRPRGSKTDVLGEDEAAYQRDVLEDLEEALKDFEIPKMHRDSSKSQVLLSDPLTKPASPTTTTTTAATGTKPNKHGTPPPTPPKPYQPKHIKQEQQNEHQHKQQQDDQPQDQPDDEVEKLKLVEEASIIGVKKLEDIKTEIPKESVSEEAIIASGNTKSLRTTSFWDEMLKHKTKYVQFSEEKINENGQKEQVLMKGSLNRILRHYLSHFGFSDHQPCNFDFPKQLIQTHLWFVTSVVLFDKFIEVYNIPTSKTEITKAERDQIKTSVCKGIRFWMQQYILHFARPEWVTEPEGSQFENPAMDERMTRFFGILERDSDFNPSSNMLNLLQITFERWKTFQIAEKAKLLALPSPLPVEGVYKKHIIELPLELLADQLTIMEFEVLYRIQIRDLRAKKWEKNDETCPVYQMVAHFNSISYWVVGTILSYHNPATRAQTIVEFSRLSQMLKDRYNFNTMMAIDGALQHTTIERLRKTMAEVSDKGRQILDSLKEFTDPAHNFLKYRTVQQSRIGFCIPYIGLYLRDLIHTEDVEDTWIDGQGLINFGKMVSIYNNAKEINRCKEIVPPHTRYPKLMELCRHFLNHSYQEDALYALSMKVEPRESQIPPGSPSSSRKISRGTAATKSLRGAKKEENINQIAQFLCLRYFTDGVTEDGNMNEESLQKMLLDIPAFLDYESEVSKCKNKQDLTIFLKSLRMNAGKNKFTLSKDKRTKLKLLAYLQELVNNSNKTANLIKAYTSK